MWTHHLPLPLIHRTLLTPSRVTFFLESPAYSNSKVPFLIRNVILESVCAHSSVLKTYITVSLKYTDEIISAVQRT